MIDTATIERYMRDANPIPHTDALDPDEFARFVAATRTRRAAIMQAPTQHETTEPHPTPSQPSRSRRAWAFAVAFVLILAAVGIAALVLRNNNPAVTDEPAPPTTTAETPDEPAPPTTTAEAPGETVSLDSITWTRVPLDEALFSGLGSDSRYQLEVSDITTGGPGLVAVGGSGPGGDTNYATVWTSPDGYTWSRVPHDEAIFGTDLVITGVTAGGPGLVAVGGVDVWLSPDGYEWSRIPSDPAVFHPIYDAMGDVIAGGPGLVGFGESGFQLHTALWTSPDGYTWTQVPHDAEVFGRSGISSMIVGGPGLVAVGFNETDRGGNQPDLTFPVVWTSPDGYDWTRVPHDPSAFTDGSGMVDVAVGSTGLVAVGFDRRDEGIVAAVWTSPDGFSWTRVPHDEATFGGFHEDMSSVAAVGDGFIAVGSWAETNVWTSPDGITWNRISADPGSGPDWPRDDAVFGEGSMHKVIAGGPGVVVLGSVPERPAMWVATSGDADELTPAGTTD